MGRLARGASRSSIVALLVLAAAIVGLLTLAVPALAFSDVGSGDWFGPSVDQLSQAGVINGYDDGSFKPYNTVTRAQFAAMLARILNPPANDASPFTDVSAADWFGPAVVSLAQAGLVSGTSPTTFNPLTLVSREQSVTLLVRALSYQHQDPLPAGSLEPQPLPDGVGLTVPDGEVSAWLGALVDRSFIGEAHRAGVANAYRLGLASGYEDGRFYPFYSLTRAQAAGLLYRAFYQSLQVKDSPPAEVQSGSYPQLTQGSSGQLVRWLKERLANLGYDVGQVNDSYDEPTKDAVMAFQKVERLSRDGQAGGEVWGRIFSAGRPGLHYGDGGDRVEVDLTRQVLFLVQGGQLSKILPISSGMPGWNTPTGTFAVQRKLPYWDRSPLGLLYMPSYFYNGYAIHGSWSVPGYPASHGCIRVPVWATPALYNQLYIGLRVSLFF
ncbi:MAG: S-layer homology domain-containing protein [Actinobacteria bacterium]|nr:S-layer homology domain-containing protein [Actinomycetota bacterium]